MNPARALLIVCLSVAFAVWSLNRITPKPQVSFAETFEGYPSDGHCDQFKIGFKTAESKQFTQKSDCETLSTNSQLGCLSYIHEYTVTRHDQI